MEWLANLNNNVNIYSVDSYILCYGVLFIEKIHSNLLPLPIGYPIVPL